MTTNFSLFNLSTEQVLASVNQAMVYEYYFRTPLILTENIKSPIRQDSNPGCKFAYDNDKHLVLFDHSKGKSYNIIQLVSELKNLSYNDAKIQIIKDFIYATKNKELFVKENIIIKEKEFNFSVKQRNFTKEELDFWCIGGVSLSEKLLNSYGIYATSLYRLNGVVYSKDVFYFVHANFIQIYNPAGDKNSPNNLKYRSNTTKGLHNFTDGINPGKCIITKSFRDAFYLSVLGFDVKFVLSEGAKIILESSDYVLYDNDSTGIEKSQELKIKYGCKTIYYPLPEKDTVDYLKVYGKEQTIKYITECIN